MPVADLIRKVGITPFYRWKKQYQGLESEQVRERNPRGEHPLEFAELTLDKSCCRMCSQKSFEALAETADVNYLCQNYSSERHACRTLRLNRAKVRSHRDVHCLAAPAARTSGAGYGYARYGLKARGRNVGKKLGIGCIEKKDRCIRLLRRRKGS